MYELSIIIVNYNTACLLENCIRSIYQYREGIRCEIIVADNASSDGSASIICEKFPEVVWIDMGYNAGFSRANNAAIKIAKSEYIFFLNSDAELVPSTLNTAIRKYKELEKYYEQLGILGFQVRGFDGEIQFNSNLSFPKIRSSFYDNPFVSYFKKKNKQSRVERLALHHRFHESAWIGLSSGIIRKDVFEKDQLFLDENFFLYHEDVEWGWRLKKKGYRSFYTPEVYTLHVNSGSTKDNNNWRSKQIQLSEFLFFKKKNGLAGIIFLYLLLRINSFSIILFKWKNCLIGKREAWVEESFSVLNWKYAIFKRYRKKIIGKLNQLEYLKYEE